MGGHAFVFPGQGSQSVGMGLELYKAFPAARAVFEEVDDTLGFKLSRLTFEGDIAELTSTENTQPALFAVSMAVVRVLEDEGGFSLRQKARIFAGHSLGEYAALAASGMISLADGAGLLRLRGQAMQRAVPVGQGGMAALLGVTPEEAEDICREAAQGQIVELANDNGGGQIVISGHEDAVERGMALARERGVRRVVKLPVSAPFHSSLMAPAAQEMAEALADIIFQPADVPVIANVTAEPVSTPEQCRDLLIRQVTGTVRWRETVLSFPEFGVTMQNELGAGKVLTGLARRIVPSLEARPIGTPSDIEVLLSELV